MWFDVGNERYTTNEIENLRATARTKAKTRGFCRARRRRVSKPPAAFLPINVEGRPSPDETEIQASRQRGQANRSSRELVRLRQGGCTVRSVCGFLRGSGFYYDGTVYTDAEEEEMIRKQFNIPM